MYRCDTCINWDEDLAPEEQEMRPNGWLCIKHDDPESLETDNKGNVRVVRHAQLNGGHFSEYYSVYDCNLFQLDLDRADDYEEACDCTDEPVCPYCGFVHMDAPYEDFPDNDGSQECIECGETFYYETETTISYTTKRRPDAPEWFKQNQENLGRDWE